MFKIYWIIKISSEKNIQKILKRRLIEVLVQNNIKLILMILTGTEYEQVASNKESKC